MHFLTIHHPSFVVLLYVVCTTKLHLFFALFVGALVTWFGPPSAGALGRAPAISSTHSKSTASVYPNTFPLCEGEKQVTRTFRATNYLLTVLMQATHRPLLSVSTPTMCHSTYLTASHVGIAFFCIGLLSRPVTSCKARIGAYTDGGYTFPFFT